MSKKERIIELYCQKKKEIKLDEVLSDIRSRYKPDDQPVSVFTKNEDKELNDLVMTLQKDEIENLASQISNQIIDMGDRASDQSENLAIEIFLKYAKNDDTLLDIGSGSGHLLLKAVQNLLANYYYGEEVESSYIEYAKQFQLLDSEYVTFKESNVLTNIDRTETYDIVYSDIPYLRRISNKEMDIFKSHSDYPIDHSINTDWLFIIRMIEAMNEDGIGVAVVRDAALSSVRDRPLRKLLLQQNIIKAIIKLPPDLLSQLGHTSTLIVLERNSENIMFVDASQECVKSNIRYRTQFTEDNIQTITDAVGTESDISRLVSYDEIEKNDYSLTPVLYTTTFDQTFHETVALNEVAQIFRGKDISKKELDLDKDKPQTGYLLNISNLQDSYISDLKQTLSNDIIKEHEKYILQEGDIVMTARGSNLKMSIIGYAEAEKTIVISSNIFIIRADQTKISPYYLYAYLRSEYGNSRIKKLQTGSTILVISQKNLQTLRIPILSEEKQLMLSERMSEELFEYRALLKKIEINFESIPKLFESYTREED